MSEMVERVARAICTAREQNGGPPWEHWEAQPGGKHVLNAFRDDARAAIEAMEVPTDAMVDFAHQNSIDSGKGTIRLIWNDMIRAAT